MSKEEDVIEVLALLGIVVNSLDREVESIKKKLKIESNEQRQRSLSIVSRQRLHKLIGDLKYDKGKEEEV